MRKSKKWISLLLMSFMIFSLLPPVVVGAVGEAAVSIQTPNNSYNVGDQFTATVYIQNNIANLVTADVQIHFDPNKLQIPSSGLTEGPLLGGSGKDIVKSEYDNQNGNIWFGISNLNVTLDTSGGNVLLYIPFTVVGAGTSTIEFRKHPDAPSLAEKVSLVDNNLDYIPYITNDKTLTLNSQDPTISVTQVAAASGMNIIDIQLEGMPGYTIKKTNDTQVTVSGSYELKGGATLSGSNAGIYFYVNYEPNDWPLTVNELLTNATKLAAGDINTSAKSFSKSVTLTLVNDEHPNVIFPIVVDSAGRIGYADSIPVFADTLGPSGTVQINNGAANAYSTAANVKVIDVDPDISQWKVANESTFQGISYESFDANGKAVTLTSGEGSKTVYVRLKDDVGNESTVLSDTIQLVNIASPQVEPIDPGTYYHARNVSLSLPEGATGTIYYTLATGSNVPADPTTPEGIEYIAGTSIIQISEQVTTIKAVNKVGSDYGQVVTFTYTIETVAAPNVKAGSSAPGSYNVPIAVELETATPSAQIYYTTAATPGLPSTNWTLYTNPVSIAVSTTITAAALIDDTWSSTNSFAYTLNTSTYENLLDIWNAVQKLKELSNGQLQFLLELALDKLDYELQGPDESKIISNAERDLLSSNGLTLSDVQVVVQTVKAHFTTNGDYDTDKMDAWRNAIVNFKYPVLVDFAEDIKAALPPAFKDTLAAKGLTAEKLMVVFWQFTNLTLSELQITASLQTKVDDILGDGQSGIYNNVDKQTLANNGLNWQNLNEFIQSLNQEQKLQIKGVMDSLGVYVYAPAADLPSGHYYQSKTVSLGIPDFLVSSGIIKYSLGDTEPVTLYEVPITISTSTTLNAVRIVNGKASSIITYDYTIAGTVAVPTADKASGTYYNSVTVSLSTTSPGAAINYTTNGSTPTASSSLYTGPLTFNTNTTLKAIAIAEGIQSDVLSRTYTIDSVAAPTALVPTGTYGVAKTVTLSTTTTGATIYYTINGTTPTVNSTPYTPGQEFTVALGQKLIIKALTSKDGALSAVSTFVYEVVAPPVLAQGSPPAGEYGTKQYVNLAAPNDQAIIYYTTDNSTPTTTSKIYTGSILVASTTTIKAIAVKAGVASTVASFAYTILTGGMTGKVTYGGVGQDGLTVNLGTKTTVTAGGGVYSFTGLLAGNYQVVVPGQKGFTAQSKSVTVVANQTANVGDFVLLRGATVSGSVTAANGGAALAGIQVSIGSPTKSGQAGFWAWTQTDASGNFWLEGLGTASDYVIKTWNDKGFVDTEQGGINLTLGQLTSGVNISMVAVADTLGSLSGTLTTDAVGNPPVQNAWVEAWSPSTYSWVSTTTNGSGQYSLEGLLPANDYVVYAWKGSQFLSVSNIVVTQGANTPGVNLQFVSPRTISGQVVNAANNQGVQGIQLWAWSENSYGWGQAITDAQGNFSMGELTPGTYTLTTGNNLFYVDQQIGGINVSQDNVTDQIISLQEGGKISGMVTRTALGEGAPIPAARVSAYSPLTGGWANVTTNNDGTFTLRGLKTANDYQVSVWKDGYYGAYLTGINAAIGGEAALQEAIVLQAFGEGAGSFTGNGNTFKSLSKTAAPGGMVSFRAELKNNGGVAANDGKLIINLPAQASYLANSAALNGNAVVPNVTGSTLEINMPVLSAGQAGVVTFQASVASTVVDTNLTATAKIAYKPGQELVTTDSIGVAIVETLYATINAPGAAKPDEEINVYGKAASDADITVYKQVGNEPGAGDVVLHRTKADGKWWSANIKLNQGTYKLYVVANVAGQSSNTSATVAVEVNASLPVLDTITVNAGWNPEFTTDPNKGVPAMSVSQFSWVNVTANFDTLGGEPDNVRMRFVDTHYALTGADKTYSGSLQIPVTAFGEELITLVYQSGATTYEVPFIEILILIDPSGYVTDGATGDPLPGVLAVVEKQDGNGSWARWNAAKYGQVNPQLTDANGYYGWDVPVGNYRVIFSKDGYETHISETVVVPPPKTDLNIGMVSLERRTMPTLVSSSPDPDAAGVAVNANVTATFSKSMKADQAMWNAGFKVKQGVNEVAGAVLYDAAAMKATFTPPANNLAFETEYTVLLDSDVLQDVDDNFLASTYSWSFMTAGQVTMASVQTNLKAYRTDSAVSISGTLFINGEEAAGETVTVTVTRPDGNTDTIIPSPTTNAQGIFNASYTAAAAGDYEVSVAYNNTTLASYDFQAVSIAEPTASLASGSHIGDRNVTLSTITQNASIYYNKTTNGQTPADPAPSTATLYNGAIIPVTTGTTKIKAIAAMQIEGDWVSSDVVAYTYVITQQQQTSTGDTTSPAPVIPPVTGTLKLDKDDVNKQLQQGLPEVSYQMDATKEQKVQLPVEVLEAIVAAGKDLVVKSPIAQVRIPAAIMKLAQGQELQLAVDAVSAAAVSQLTDKLPGGMASLGRVVELTLTTTAGQQIQFNQPVTVTFNYKDLDLSKVNVGKLGVYWYNETSKNWEYVGGKVNSAEQTITFKAAHFSKFAIMEYSKVFSDMVGHWAKEDVELMASKHIINGKTVELYDPETSVTRAEFAALIVRSMRLKGDPQAVLGFKDVAANKWYYGEIATAFKQGLIYGVSATEFEPDAVITREQMAVMVMRALEKEGQAMPAGDAEAQGLLQPFKDSATVSNWAVSQTAAAVKLGIITGRSADQIVPQAQSSRAEAAVILHRMVKILN